MPQYTNPKCAVNGTATTLTTQGGTYNWGLMPLEPDSSMTDAQRQAIGKLTSDVGICCNMKYKSGASSAGGHLLALRQGTPRQFHHRFGAWPGCP
jgi:hypothetical protein